MKPNQHERNLKEFINLKKGYFTFGINCTVFYIKSDLLIFVALKEW